MWGKIVLFFTKCLRIMKIAFNLVFVTLLGYNEWTVDRIIEKRSIPQFEWT